MDLGPKKSTSQIEVLCGLSIKQQNWYCLSAFFQTELLAGTEIRIRSEILKYVFENHEFVKLGILVVSRYLEPL